MRPLLPIAIVLAALTAACGGSDAGPGTSTPATPSGGVAATAVDIKDFAFNPPAVTVKPGQRITWTNQDSAVHNVVAGDGTFKSPDLKQGDSFTYTAKKAGTFSYVCTYHPNMKATLTVTG